ncbi:MAG: TonB-dependent receptor, partial [bacterium]
MKERNKLSRAVARVSAGMVSAGIAAVIPLGASAQINEVIVTAQKREQNVQEVPISVTAISGLELQEKSVTDVFDLQQITPGLTVQQNQNATTSNFSIRGVGTSGSNFGLESSVGLYVDGVYRARQSSMINEMVDMAGVEVLRGPQGTLFGRNSPSGAVLMKTQEPTHEFGGYLDIDVGNLNLFSANGAVGGSLIEDVLAWRLTGFTTERDGYIDDVTLGDETINDRDRQGFRGQLLWTPSEDLSVRLIADHSEIDEACCAAVTVRNNNFVFARNSFSGTISETPGAGSDLLLPFLNPGAIVVSEDQKFDDVVNFSVLPNSQNEDKGLSIQADWDVGGGTLTSISAWRKFDSDDLVDADFADVDLATRDEHAEQESFSQEIRFSKEFDGGHYVIGAYYFQQDLDTESNTVIGEHLNDFVAGGLSGAAEDLDDILDSFGQLENKEFLSQSAQNLGLNCSPSNLPNLDQNGQVMCIADLSVLAGQAATGMIAELQNLGMIYGNALHPELQDLSALAFFNPGFSGVGIPMGMSGTNFMKQEHKAWAIFGQIDWRFAEKLELSVGLRYTDESKKLNGKFIQPGGPIGVGQTVLPIDLELPNGLVVEAGNPIPSGSWGLYLGLDDLTIFNPRPDIDETLNDEQITGDIKLKWFPKDDIMFYASYATGYKSGGTNTDRISVVRDPIFDAETAETYELGMKADFPEQSVRLNVTLHHTTTKDYQTNAFQGAGFNLINAGEVETKGGELELWWYPTDDLEVSAAYVYNEGEFVNFVGNCWTANTWLTGQQDPGRAFPTATLCDRSGDPLDTNPEHTVMLSVTQRFQLADNVGASLHADYNWRDETYKDGNIDPLKLEDGYGIL